MARDLSATLRAAIGAEATADVVLLLVTISGAGLATIRIVNDNADVTSGGDLYSAFPFEVTLPADMPDGMPKMKLNICNIDRQIVASLRALSVAPTVVVELIRADDPDTVEATFHATLRNAEYNVDALACDLAYEDVLNEPIPGDLFSPNATPGVFL
jgi:hypothetical protein